MNKPDIPPITEKDILTQMGYYREDTCFMSLNLTPAQFKIFCEASAKADQKQWSMEEAITRALCMLTYALDERLELDDHLRDTHES